MIEWTELASGFDEQSEQELIEFLQRQRWFAGKGRGVSSVELLDRIFLPEDRSVAIVLINVHYGTGNPEHYQLVLSVGHEDADQGWPLVAKAGDGYMWDASVAPHLAQLSVGARDDSVPGSVGEVRFQAIRDMHKPGDNSRLVAAEQSNTAVILDERVFFKIYRNLDTGINPELELLLFLTQHSFPHVPALIGWYSYNGPDLLATLGVAQDFIPDVLDGWYLGMQELAHDPEAFLARLGRLGEVVGALHCVLASDASDEDFAPEDPTDETMALLGASIEEQLIVASDLIPDGRADALRTLLQMLTKGRPMGKLIRTHGDLHLGQALWAGDDWLIIDFEGEPARTLVERRRKRHPLRDVAGMLRSFAYLARAADLELGVELEPDWEPRAREQFLTGYREQVAPAGIIPDIEEQRRLIRVFEIEKLLYEIGYERDHRPDWLTVPLSGIGRLLDEVT